MNRRSMFAVMAAAIAAAVISAVLLIRFDAPFGDSAGAAIRLGGPFRLVDQNGNTVTDKDLIGRPTLLFFGYTHCPDACPTTLAELTDLTQKIGPAADRLNVVFVTVDPERDTPQVMADYAKAFDPRFRFLTGTPDEIRQMLRGYRVYAQKTEGEGGDYLMNHTASVYLLDREGRFVGTLAYQEPEDAALAKLRRLLAA